MNFFEIANQHLLELNKNEREMFNFIVKNMNKIIGKSIREMASMLYVSTATVLRFVHKLGFSGYSEFMTVIKFTNEIEEQDEELYPIDQDNYAEEYLKNIAESIHVIQADRVDKIVNKLKENPRIYLFANNATKHITEYINYLYSMTGFDVIFPHDHDYRKIAATRIDSDDLIFILSYKGDNSEFIKLINQYISRGKRPLLVSITEADNNVIQNLSDVNLYIFTDKVIVNNVDISSQISIAGIMELILYKYIKSNKAS